MMLELHGEKALAAADTGRVIVHFDVDAFYAQVEELRDPSRRTKPLGVTQKFLIVTANYPARERGVKKLMSTADALRVCPDLVTVNGEDLTPYRRANKALLDVLRRYGPVQKLGLDEVFVDVTAAVQRPRVEVANSNRSYCWAGHILAPSATAVEASSNKHRPAALRGQPSVPPTAVLTAEHLEESSLRAMYGHEAWWERLRIGSVIADEARRAIREETGLRTSAGIACNKLLAKMISGIHKPDGQTILLPPHAADFVGPLPVRALPSVGSKLDNLLCDIQVNIVANLRQLSETELRQRFGDRIGVFLAQARWGNDSSQVTEQDAPKVITVEDSFRACRSFGIISKVLYVLAPDLLLRLDEDAHDHGRRPTRLVVKWRHKSQGWQRNSASAAFPVSALASEPLERRAKVLSAAAFALLSLHLTEQFELTLISLGATAFIQSSRHDNHKSIADFVTKNDDKNGQKSENNVSCPPPPVLLTRSVGPQEDLESPEEAAMAADRSIKQRRNYGNGMIFDDTFSKRHERQLREMAAGVADTRGGAIECHDTDAPGGEGAFDEEDDIWGDLMSLHNSRRRVQPMPNGAGLSTLPPAGTTTQNTHNNPQRHAGLEQSAAALASRVIVHCDIDCFYCAVERLDDPSLEGIPLAVEQFNSGGFVAVSYEARAAGVRCGDGAGAGGRSSVPHLVAMKARSISECRLACPGLVVKPMRPQRYREIGEQILALLRTTFAASSVEKTSCDDFYLDVTDVGPEMPGSGWVGTPPPGAALVKIDGRDNYAANDWLEMAEDLRRGTWAAYGVKQVLKGRLGLTASCGVGRSKLVARLASPMNKPNGLTLVPDVRAVSFVRSIPLRRVPSLQGRFGAHVMAALGVEWVGDLAAWSVEELQKRFGRQRGAFLIDLFNGVDRSPIVDRKAPMTISSERSFPPIPTAEALTDVARKLGDVLLRRALQDAQSHNRLPTKFRVMYRLGYDEAVPSKLVDIPPAVIEYLKRMVHSEKQFEVTLDAICLASLDVIRGALGGSTAWNITRLALSLVYKEEHGIVETSNTAHAPIKSFLLPKVGPETGLKLDSSQGGLGGKDKDQDLQARSSYRNNEAMKLRRMLQRGTLDAHEALVPDDDAASLALAIRLQREEAEALRSGASGSISPSDKKRKTHGVLDNFVIREKTKRV